jgi:hypothetical protein
MITMITEDGHKTCTRCQERKEANLQNFPPDKRNNDGLKSHCRVCERKRVLAWHKANPGRQLAWQKNNPEKAKAYTKKWQAKKKEVDKSSEVGDSLH